MPLKKYLIAVNGDYVFNSLYILNNSNIEDKFICEFLVVIMIWLWKVLAFNLNKAKQAKTTWKEMAFKFLCKIIPIIL